MGTYGVIDFNDEEIEAAGHWYGGQGSMLYAITSTGSLKRGTIRPRNDDGTPMTDDEWIVDLAERLESEAEEAARDAGKQAKKAKGTERAELRADQDGLRSIAFKASQFIRGAKRAQKSGHATRRTTRGSSQHATKKSAAQLQREIDEALANPQSRKTVLRWDPAVRGRGEVTARSGYRAFVQPLSAGKWHWEVKPVGYEVLDPKRSVGTGTASSKAAAKAAASRLLLSQL